MRVKETKFDTRRYVTAHGKKPRGQGQWMFAPPGWEREDDPWAHVLEVNGTFASARKQVSGKHPVLEVLS